MIRSSEDSRLEILVEELGFSYSRRLGLDPSSGDEDQLFQWFLASILFGAPISEKTAEKTFKLFQAERLTDPEKLLEAGWDRLVEILDAGGYTRYDFKTADKLLEMAENLERLYGGSLLKLHEESSDGLEFEKKIMGLAKGIGPVTLQIFLREAYEALPKAEPLPSKYEILAARNLEITNLEGETREELRLILNQIEEAWRQSGLKVGFPEFRVALLRLGRDYCRKTKCSDCFVSPQHCTHVSTR
jgi:endonuclease III